MPRVPPAHLDARRAQIVAAAAACFARKGVDGTTMADIFAESGLSAGAVYNYFDGKQALLRAVVDHHVAENARSASALQAGAADVWDMLAASLADFDDPAREADLRLPVALFGEALHDAEVAAGTRRLYRATVESFRAAIVALQAEGRVDPELDAEYLCWVVVATFEGWRVLKCLDPHLSTRRFTDVYRAVLAPLFRAPR